MENKICSYFFNDCSIDKVQPYLHHTMGCPSWNSPLPFREMEDGTEPLPTLKKCFYNFGNISQKIGSPFLCSPPKLFKNKIIIIS